MAIFRISKELVVTPQLLMAIIGICKELVVILKYFYEKSVAETTLKCCFHNRFRTLAYSELEVNWEACQYTPVNV